MQSLQDTIVILDFGSQYTQLIARRIREFHVFSVILPAQSSVQDILAYQPKGLILSGGPASVTQAHAPKFNSKTFKLGIPILGICYGMQLIAHHCGGTVDSTHQREFGRADLLIDNADDLLKGIKGKIPVSVEVDCATSLVQFR